MRPAIVLPMVNLAAVLHASGKQFTDLKNNELTQHMGGLGLFDR